MRAHKLAVAAAGGALGLLVAGPVAAWADSTAPVGSATGSDLSLGSTASPIASVSSTGASAGGSSSGSSADVVSVAGQPVIGGSSSDGSTSGSQGDVLDTGSSLPVEAQVAPYSATSSAPAGGSSSSEGKTAVARLSGSGVSANVLQSDSKAQYTTSPGGTTTQSGGSSSTDALTVSAGGLNLDVLHSDASSSGQGSTYLLGINGTDIGTSQQMSSICSAVRIPSVLALSCDTATGGIGSLLEQVAGATFGSGQSGLGLAAFSSGASGGPGAAAAGPGPVAGSAPAPAQVQAQGVGPAAPIGNATSSGGSLPFTGAPIALWLFGSAALLGLGAVTVKASHLVAPQLFG